jgi:hypothetical protein
MHQCSIHTCSTLTLAHTHAHTHTHTCVPPAAVQALAISPGPSSRPLNSIRCTRKGVGWATSTKPRHTDGPSLVYQTSALWQTRHTVAKKRENGVQRTPAPGSLQTGSTHRDSAAEGKKLPQRRLVRRWRHVEHLRSADTDKCASAQARMSVAAKGAVRQVPRVRVPARSTSF